MRGANAQRSRYETTQRSQQAPFARVEAMGQRASSRPGFFAQLRPDLVRLARQTERRGLWLAKNRVQKRTAEATKASTAS